MEETKRETRNTKQRRLIVDCLQKYGNNPLTAEEIYNQIKEHDQQISIATVYRNLKLLEEQGTIKKNVVSEETSSFYELSDSGEPHSHHHLICERCGKIIDFDKDLLGSLEKVIEQTRDFTIVDHRVVFYGVCSECKKKEKEAEAEGRA